MVETPPSIRITIPLSKENPETNVFNMHSIRKLHVAKLAKPNITTPAKYISKITKPTDNNSNDVIEIHSASEDDMENNQDESEHDEKDGKDIKKRKVTHPDHFYDLDDDFIDDQDLFAEIQMDCGGDEPVSQPDVSEFGFFVWRGSLDDLFRNPYLVYNYSELVKLKKSFDVSSSSATISNVAPLKTLEKIKTKKEIVNNEASSSANIKTPVSKKSNSVVKTASSSSQPKVKKLKVTTVDSPVVRTESINSQKSIQQLPSSALVVVSDDLDISPLPDLVLEKLEVLRKASSSDLFAVKKIFPPVLKPLLSEAAAVAMDHNRLGTLFFKHVVSILPYNSFTMRVFFILL
jgi:hypothetical protein